MPTSKNSNASSAKATGGPSSERSSSVQNNGQSQDKTDTKTHKRSRSGTELYLPTGLMLTMARLLYLSPTAKEVRRGSSYLQRLH